MGKYRIAREEERIFMFLDLKSSTVIAEEMGHRRYFEFMSEFIADATIPIMKNHGEVYQYVGDEIVICWKTEKGNFDPHCIKCFFDIKERIQHDSAKYIKRYGKVPTFKAGMHFGEVMVGEVGVIKRDLIMSGDAVNTTAHIQSKCNDYDAELLMSTVLVDKLSTTIYQVNPLGAVWLKGKRSPIELNSVHIA